MLALGFFLSDIYLTCLAPMDAQYQGSFYQSGCLAHIRSHTCSLFASSQRHLIYHTSVVDNSAQIPAIDSIIGAATAATAATAAAAQIGNLIALGLQFNTFSYDAFTSDYHAPARLVNLNPEYFEYPSTYQLCQEFTKGTQGIHGKIQGLTKTLRKKEKDRVLLERQQAAGNACRASKRRC
ncbi:hypothetical protein BCR42DRAFT_454246 [Absidia repens]|uniref:Uncharacterized protein n=1 Tax=Absidia repens TaxID=90262 RepID=A0A1X2I843_9FUNG|nr:hypothetical protein BCR42DRAFT_454246 [Absidia repens]